MLTELRSHVVRDASEKRGRHSQDVQSVLSQDIVLYFEDMSHDLMCTVSIHVIIEIHDFGCSKATSKCVNRDIRSLSMNQSIAIAADDILGGSIVRCSQDRTARGQKTSPRGRDRGRSVAELLNNKLGLKWC